LIMNHSTKLSATHSLLQKAASIAVSHTFPAWIDAGDCIGIPSAVMPRVRDGLVLRLVAGRRQERDRSLVHATSTS
jgi:hypothetical protein